MGVVGVDHAAHVALDGGCVEVVAPGIAVGLHPCGRASEDLADRGELGEGVVALVQPVAVLVGLQFVPGVVVEGGGGEDVEFGGAVEVVADVSVVDGGGAGVGGVLDAQRDRDRVAATGVEDIVALLLPQLACGAGVPAEVEDPDVAELFLQGEAHALGRVPVEPAAVGDEGHDAALAEAVGGPAVGADVGVVEAVLVGCGGAGGIRVADAGVEGGIAQVGVVVVGAGLPDGVWRVTDDDGDVGGELFGDAFVVGG